MNNQYLPMRRYDNPNASILRVKHIVRDCWRTMQGPEYKGRPINVARFPSSIIAAMAEPGATVTGEEICRRALLYIAAPIVVCGIAGEARLRLWENYRDELNSIDGQGDYIIDKVMAEALWALDGCLHWFWTKPALDNCAPPWGAISLADFRAPGDPTPTDVDYAMSKHTFEDFAGRLGRDAANQYFNCLRNRSEGKPYQTPEFADIAAGVWPEWISRPTKGEPA